MFELTIDEATGIIRVTGTGRWDIATIDAHFDRLEMLLAALRRQGAPIRMLTDARGAEPRSAEIEARIDARMRRLQRPGDRFALVVRNNLRKSHLRTIATVDDAALFCSHAAAETWLMAHDRRLRA